MDKENGETSDSGTGTNKLSNAPDPASLLDAANIFSAAYWPRTDAANSSSPAGLFAGGTFGPLGPHPSLPFGLIPPTAAAAAAAAAASGRGVPAFPPVSNAAYSNTLSVAASQAASLGLPAASAAWWSMASQLAAHDYLARLQASGGLNFPPLSSPGELPYSSLGLPGLPHHKSSKGSSKASSLAKGSGSSKGKSSATALSLQAGAKLDGRLDPSKPQQPVQQQQPPPPLSHPNNVSLYGKSVPSRPSAKTSSSLTIQPSVPKPPVKKPPSLPSPKPPPSLPPPSTAAASSVDKQPLPLSLPKSSTPKSTHQPPSSSIFTSPLSLVSNSERSSAAHTTSTTQSIVNSTTSSGIAPNILSDPSSILGGVRLPPDTEIIKYTSSIVGPKIPGTTNRGRKKTISLDPPSVSVMPTHSSTGMLIDRGTKWPKMSQEPQDLSTTNDRVEVIKLPATNGSPSGINIPAYGTGGSSSDPSNDAPLNLSLKPASTSVSTNCQSNSLNSLSTLSANIGSDRISRRKPGPKPRRVIQSPSQLSGTAPGAPSASLTQLFAAADSPRPPSRSEDPEPTPLPPPQVNVQPPAITTITTTISSSISSSSSSSSSSAGPPTMPPVSGAGSPAPAGTHQPNHKDGRPRNLGRGVSKPKKNTVASLLAQSRALGIKPMQIDPNTPMNQQISMLKSNMLAAQQYMADSMDDKHLEKLRGALSDSSNMEVSTDSDNLTDSNPTDSEAETDANGASNPKKRRHFNERELRLPLDQGWKRETIIRGLTKNGGIKGDVCYTPPDTNNKLKHISDIVQYLEQSGTTDLTKENFTFSCKIILGEYLQKPPPGATSEGEYLRMSEEDVTKRLDDLRSSARTTLGVEQRIEVARRQQAARAAARHDREQARAARDLEKTEKQEAARRDREARSHQLLEGRKRLAFTLEQKVQIISEIEGGKTKSDVSRELGLASSTVATIWKNRDHILNAYGTEPPDSDHKIHTHPQWLDHDWPAAPSRVPTPPPTPIPPPPRPSSSSSTSAVSSDTWMARRKRHEELNRQRLEEQQRKLQEREMKKQQAALIKEQMYIQEINKQREMLYTVELEKERRRQHMALVRALEARRRLEERERKKQQAILEKQASKERRMEQRRIDLEILTELRKPCEDLELSQKPLPDYQRIPGLRLSGQAFADILMVFEFLHNFGETLGFDMDSLPCLDSLQQALLNESTDAEEELLSVMTHLLVCAIEDPGIPNPARHTTILGQSLRQADITHSNLSEILRIYLYANATGEVKALTGVHFERDREKRVADHYQNCAEMQHTQGGKNAAYYELLHENTTWRMSDSLKDKPFLALSPTDKAAMLAFLCNELLQNKAVIRQVEGSLETVTQLRKDRWLLDTKIRKLRMLLSRKLRAEAAERMQAQLKEGGGLDGSMTAGDTTPRAVDSPAPTPTPHKDDLLVDEEDEISENESEGTQPEEEEDKKLSSEELTKKLEKLIKASETQLQSLNTSAHQLRATCYGQDRYWRRYWSLPTAGGVFIEAMESAQPEVYQEQLREAECAAIKLQNISDIITESDTAQDPLTDCEVSQIVANELDTNEHRKTPNRLGETPNANNITTDEVGTIDETTSSGAGPSAAPNCNDMNETEPVGLVKSEPNDIEEQIPSKLVQKTIGTSTTPSTVVKGYSIFEKLGECMEKENKSETDTSDIKVQQSQISSITSVIGDCHVGPIIDDKDNNVTEVKSEIKIEPKTETDEEKGSTSTGAAVPDSDVKWFSIVARDGHSCEGVNMTAGNRWDTNIVGVCTRDSVAELKIPVFPPPNCGSGYVPCGPCDSPGPLQMSPEESAQLEYIKAHGPPARLEACLVPAELRTGWWRVSDPDQLRAALDAMHARGVRERELKRTFQLTMQSMYESATHVHIEEGQRTAADLNDCPEGSRIMLEKAASVADKPGAWNPAVATRVDFSVLEQVEALEDKVANASMQVKGWKVPNRDSDEVVVPGEAVPLAKERLAALEAAIERRYLKPPLGISTGDVNLAAIAQEACGLNSSTSSSSTSASSSSAGSGGTSSSANSSTGQQSAHSQSAQSATGPADSSATNSGTCASAAASPPAEDIPKGLVVWRDAVQRSQTSAQLAMCLYMLESCIAWDKSIMKANCQFCHSGDNEDKLLLCDSCDKGYHTYCFRPKMETIPEGNWYCHECINKVTGERNCIVCGKKQSTGKLILCDLCPRAYHQDCLTPPLTKVPRGKWYCPNCHAKQPKKRNSRRSNNKAARDSESSDHPPSSPAPSHSSVTTNEDANNQPNVAANNSRDAPPNLSTQSNASPSTSASRKDRISKKLQKELAPCKALLEDLECHDDAWPFLLPVNTKQFPTYRKIITSPMDLSTIKKRLQDLHYKSREEFCMDVRQIFDNCETFNEDDSPVGKAGHCMRQFFEARWNELCPPHLNKS